MGHITKVGICFTIILAGLCSGIWFEIIPANAHIHIHIEPYQPGMIYLGRENSLESDDLPYDLEHPEHQYIYAIVQDAYGKNLSGSLSYTISDINTGKLILKKTNMTLIYGNSNNGTWRGEILKPPNVNEPYTVHYNASFRDNLNYFVTKPGPYFDNDKYTGNDYHLVSGQGYNVAYRYIEARQYQGQFQNTTGFVALVSDNRTNMPYEVTLYYKLNNTQPYQWQIMTPATNNTTLKPYPVENELHGVIHEFYSTSLTLPPHTKVTQSYATLHDSEGKDIKATSFISSTPYHTNSISVKLDVSKVDVGNRTADVRIILDGPLIRDTTIPSTERYIIGDSDKIDLQLIDNNNTNILNLPASFHNLTHIIYPEKFHSFHAVVRNGLNTLTLTGDPKEFPYDQYSGNLTIKIPLKNVKIDNSSKPRYDGLHNSPWSLTSWKDEGLMPRSGSGYTFLNVKMEFSRNQFFLDILILPILLVFFLLGIILFLEPEGHDLVARIGITLAVFAFVFTFDSILPTLKPYPTISTFTDFLLKLVLLAAIAYTISSVIGSVTRKRANKWIKKIHSYRIYDVLAPLLVLVLSIYELSITKEYSLGYSGWFIIIIMIGLGWGILAHVISRYTLRHRRGEEEEEKRRQAQKELNKKRIPEEISEHDLSKAIENMVEKKVEELRERKNSFGDYFIDEIG